MALESVFILLGSNLGNRELLVNQANSMIEEQCGEVIVKSDMYESEPWGFKAQQWFLNEVVLLRTSFLPDELMTTLLSIEKKLGRDRTTPHNGYVSRPIDLDILYFGEKIVDTQDVTAPHPRLHLRRFTLLPLCDIAPDFVHPVLRLTNRQLLEQCHDFSEVKKYQ